jgi:hypothetical protein
MGIDSAVNEMGIIVRRSQWKIYPTERIILYGDKLHALTKVRQTTLDEFDVGVEEG